MSNATPTPEAIAARIVRVKQVRAPDSDLDFFVRAVASQEAEIATLQMKCDFAEQAALKVYGHALKAAEAEIATLRQERDAALKREFDLLQVIVDDNAKLDAAEAENARLRAALTKAHDFAVHLDAAGDWWLAQRNNLCDELEALLAPPAETDHE